MLPWHGWVYSRGFLMVTVLAGLLGLYLRCGSAVGRVFGLAPWFFSLEGAALAGAALLASKLLHEAGAWPHRQALWLPVPSMGVALLVMAPVLYTDTSGAWRLRERTKRLAIGSAGWRRNAVLPPTRCFCGASCRRGCCAPWCSFGPPPPGC